MFCVDIHRMQIVKSCWQIRDELAGNGGPNGEFWLVSCTECRAYAAGVSCWELDTPRCCAPVHMTCDFCALYIDHRREIASLTQKLPAPPAGRNTRDLPPRQAPDAWPTAPWGEPVSSQKEDASSIMEKLQLNVPDMYADHHVLRVRAALAALEPNVQNVVASSAFRLVAFEYNPAAISAEAIQAALAEAGYATGAGQGLVVNPVSPAVTPGKGFDPAWERLGVRVSRTDARDSKPAR